MSDFLTALPGILGKCANTLREARLPSEVAEHMERLMVQVDQPCVLAVVGRAKAGKSTFINALLGEDLAKVGTTETTATINFFCYGTPNDPDRPVRCHWRGGRIENVSRAFLDSLQGNDLETLRRSAGIEFLEYFLPSPRLREVTLVDTPGTEAVLDEHQQVTAEFLNLKQQLRQRHNEETERWAGQADAVIYLVGQVPRVTDQAFLDEFAHATGGRSRALNAIGVLAKIDLQPELLERRQELAARIAQQFREGLNTVIPVSAGIHRALDHLQKNGNRRLIRLITTLRRIPPRRLEKLLDSDELYEMEFDDCPVSVDERRELRGDLPWGVFTTIARQVADPALSGQAIVQRLEELAGFGPLRDVLERHFFRRARLLRCYRIVNEARQILNDIRYKYLPEFLKLDRADRVRQERFLAFIRTARGDPRVARELEEFVTRQLVPYRADHLEVIRQELDRKLGQFFHEMEEYNADFEALEELENHARLFSSPELDELRPLLGLYGVETEKRLPPGKTTVEHASERQQYWAGVRLRTRNFRSRIAERAETRYGLILSELLQSSPPRTAPPCRL